jgi:hypothetical protein
MTTWKSVISNEVRDLFPSFRRKPGSFVTPVKTGVQPLNLDTVFQRYDGRCPSPGGRREFILSRVEAPA